MLKQLAELCEGAFSLRSQVGKGTTLSARFKMSSIDLPPMGDLPGTMRSLILGAPDQPEFVLEYSMGQQRFTFDTREVRQALGGLSLAEPDILSWIAGYIAQGMAEVQGTTL
jgi:hypothetical protein